MMGQKSYKIYRHKWNQTVPPFKKKKKFFKWTFFQKYHLLFRIQKNLGLLLQLVILKDISVFINLERERDRQTDPVYSVTAISKQSLAFWHASILASFHLALFKNINFEIWVQIIFFHSHYHGVYSSFSYMIMRCMSKGQRSFPHSNYIVSGTHF